MKGVDNMKKWMVLLAAFLAMFFLTALSESTGADALDVQMGIFELDENGQLVRDIGRYVNFSDIEEGHIYAYGVCVRNPLKEDVTFSLAAYLGNQADKSWENVTVPAKGYKYYVLRLNSDLSGTGTVTWKINGKTVAQEDVFFCGAVSENSGLRGRVSVVELDEEGNILRDLGTQADLSALWMGHRYAIAFTLFNSGTNGYGLDRIEMTVNGNKAGVWENKELYPGEDMFFVADIENIAGAVMVTDTYINGNKVFSETLRFTENGLKAEIPDGFEFEFYISEEDESGKEVKRHTGSIVYSEIPAGHTATLMLAVKNTGTGSMTFAPLYIKVNSLTRDAISTITVGRNSSINFSTGISVLPEGTVMLSAELDGKDIVRGVIEVRY